MIYYFIIFRFFLRLLILISLLIGFFSCQNDFEDYKFLYKEVQNTIDKVSNNDLEIINSSQNKLIEIRYSNFYEPISYYIDIFESLDVLLIEPLEFDSNREQIRSGTWYITSIQQSEFDNILNNIKANSELRAFEDFDPSRIFPDNNDNYHLYTYILNDKILPFQFSVENTKINSTCYYSFKYIVEILLRKKWKKVIGKYYYNKLNGLLIRYRDNSDTLKEIREFKENELNGISFSVSEKGSIDYAKYINGLLDGDAYTFYNNGMIKFHLIYKNNNALSLKEYYKSGKIKTIVFYESSGKVLSRTEYGEY